MVENLFQSINNQYITILLFGHAAYPVSGYVRCKNSIMVAIVETMMKVCNLLLNDISVHSRLMLCIRVDKIIPGFV